MEAVTAANVGDDWHTGSDGTGGGGPVVPIRRRQDDAIDSMLQVPAQMFPSAGEVHPGVSLTFQRRIGVAPGGHPPPPGHPGPPVPSPPQPALPHFPALHAPLPLGANAGRYPPLPALAPPPQKRNSVGSGSSASGVSGGAAGANSNVNAGGNSVNVGGGASGSGGTVNVNSNVVSGAGGGSTVGLGVGTGGGVVGVNVGGNGGMVGGVGVGGVVLPSSGGVGGMRPVNELLALPSKDLSSAEHRRVRKVLLSRKRARRSGTSTAPVGEIEAEVAAKRPVLDTLALARLDKKQIRQIKNRDVALKARQKAKAKVQRLESENTNLKNKALTLERENNLLRSQIETLKSTIGDPTREQSWNGDVTLESMVPGP